MSVIAIAEDSDSDATETETDCRLRNELISSLNHTEDKLKDQATLRRKTLPLSIDIIDADFRCIISIMLREFMIM